MRFTFILFEKTSRVNIMSLTTCMYFLKFILYYALHPVKRVTYLILHFLKNLIFFNSYFLKLCNDDNCI